MASCTAESSTRAIVLLLLGCIFVGFVECITATLSSVCLEDQREIGTALGVGASARSFVSTLGSVVYTVILSNRLAKTIPEQVPTALINAGLSESQTGAFLTAYTNGTQAAFDAVKGLTPHILDIGTHAYKVASADAYRTVFYATIGFSTVGFILTFFVPDMDHLLTGEVSTTLHKKNNEDALLGVGGFTEKDVESN
jgi:hypothetical protein